MGGRLILINSVLTAIPLFQLSFFKFPAWVIRDIDKIRRNFLWAGVDHKSIRKIPLISWKSVCLKQEYGGLGIMDLNEMNLAFLIKLGWLYNRNDFKAL